MCLPAFALSDSPEAQAANALPSIEHSNRAPGGVEVKEKETFAFILAVFTFLAGVLVRVVSGTFGDAWV